VSGLTIGQRVRAHGLLGIIRAVHYSHGAQSNVFTVDFDNGTRMRVEARHVVAA
jgi:hypothetical protein